MKLIFTVALYENQTVSLYHDMSHDLQQLHTGMFGGGKIWQIASSIVVGEKKFGECLQQCCMDYYYYEMD